mgnify:CR=1 FL=1
MKLKVVSTDRLELETDEVEKGPNNEGSEVARLVVKGKNGKKAIFFVTLFAGDNPKLEVIGKTMTKERSASITADWLNV